MANQLPEDDEPFESKLPVRSVTRHTEGTDTKTLIGQHFLNVFWW